MPILTIPLALIALSALPALAAIYWLRNRYRRQEVSSLLLWMDQRQPREGGVRLQRVQTPLLFMIELLALALLVLAATDPRVLASDQTRMLVVVLDDSYAMRAGEAGHTPRDQAEAALRDELESVAPFAVRFVLAGARPQVMGEPVSTWRAAEALLTGWQCWSPHAELDAALALARQVGGAESRLLVLTDRAAVDELEPGRLRWLAFGAARANVAFTNAVRSSMAGADEGQRAMLEIANLSDAPSTTTLTVSGRPQPLQLAAGEHRRLWYDLPRGAGAMEALLGEDALAVDNRVTLLPVHEPTLRVANELTDPLMQSAVQHALDATGRVRTLGGGAVHLRITDRAAPLRVQRDAPAEVATWQVQMLAEEQTSSYLGPFVVDRSHRMAAGVSLEGVIWAAGAQEADAGAGTPIITAGNVPLLTQARLPGGAPLLRWRWQPTGSNLHQHPAFPALIWNLIDWRLTELPGIAASNVRLGLPIQLALPLGVTEFRMTEPQGEPRTIAARQQTLELDAPVPGIYELTWDERDGAEATPGARVAVNVMSTEGSDLRSKAAGTWGGWLDERTLREQYRGVSWLLLLAVLGLLSLHAWLISRQAGGRA